MQLRFGAANAKEIAQCRFKERFSLFSISDRSGILLLLESIKMLGCGSLMIIGPGMLKHTQRQKSGVNRNFIAQKLLFHSS